MRVSAIQGPVLTPPLHGGKTGSVHLPKVNEKQAFKMPQVKNVGGMLKGAYWGTILGGLSGMALMATGVGAPVAAVYFGSLFLGAFLGGMIGNKTEEKAKSTLDIAV